MSTELIERMNQILTETEVPERHTFFQIEKFIIGKEPTHQGQLWQIIRELRSRQESVESILSDMEQAEDDLELFDLKVERANREIKRLSESEGNDLDIKELELAIRKLQREKTALEKSAEKARLQLKYTLEEVSFLVSGYERVLKEVGKVKSVDDAQAQAELWNEKLLEQFNLRILLRNPIDSELVRTIMALDDTTPVKKHVAAILQRSQQKMLADMQQEQQLLQQAEVKPKIEG